MKSVTLLLNLALIVGFSSVAQAGSGKMYGYINEGRGGKIYFIAANMDYQNDPTNGPLEALIPLENFSDDQIDVMGACMQNREVNVIVVERKLQKVQVPTGIPGRNTTVTAPSITSVGCEKKPGFVHTWRELVRQSRFK